MMMMACIQFVVFRLALGLLPDPGGYGQCGHVTPDPAAHGSHQPAAQPQGPELSPQLSEPHHVC